MWVYVGDVQVKYVCWDLRSMKENLDMGANLTNHFLRTLKADAQHPRPSRQLSTSLLAEQLTSLFRDYIRRPNVQLLMTNI